MFPVVQVKYSQAFQIWNWCGTTDVVFCFSQVSAFFSIVARKQNGSSYRVICAAVVLMSGILWPSGKPYEIRFDPTAIARKCWCFFTPHEYQLTPISFLILLEIFSTSITLRIKDIVKRNFLTLKQKQRSKSGLIK